MSMNEPGDRVDLQENTLETDFPPGSDADRA